MLWNLLITLLLAYFVKGFHFAVNQWDIDTKYLAQPWALFIFQVVIWPLAYCED